MSSSSSELKSILYKAGAGAGKTTRLTETFLNFAVKFKSENGRFPHIVVTTFTKKATQELRERLILLAQKKQDNDLIEYLQVKSMVHISTIHGVLSLLLKKYGHEIGLSTDFNFVSELEEKKQIKKIIKDLVINNEDFGNLLEENSFKDLIRDIQRYFRFYFTELNFKRADIAYLKKQNIEDLNRLKSELDEIANQILESSSNEAWQAYAEACLNLKWLQPNEEITDFSSRLDHFKEQFSKLKSTEKNPAVSAEIKKARSDWNKKTKDFAKKYWHLTDDFLNIHEQQSQLFESLATQTSEKLLQHKIDQAELTMSDLELFSAILLQKSPTAFDYFSREWNFWMVDEYQDTSPLQVRLLKAMIGSSPQFIVGDPQQSIYLFRGARSEVFEEKKQNFIRDNMTVAELMTNYRSQAPVLNFINTFFTRLSTQFAKMEIGHNQPPVQSLPAIQIFKIPQREQVEDKKSELSDSDSADEPSDQGDESESILNIETQDHMKTVVAEIQLLINSGVDPQSICVLARDNKTLDQLAYFALQYRLPIQQHSGGGFFDRLEVKDALAILQFLINPHDNLNLLTLFRSPWLSIPDSVIHLHLLPGVASNWQHLSKNMSDHQVINYLIVKQGLLNSRGIVQVFQDILFERGLFEFAHRLDSSGRREANLWKIVSMVSEIEKTSGDFFELQDSIEQAVDPDSQSQDSDATPVIEPKKISLMTIHASKGLQFDYIFMPMLQKNPRAVRFDGLTYHEDQGTWSLPVRHPESSMTTYSIDAHQHKVRLAEREEQESERLLYVALTRAIKGIRLFWHSTYKGKKNWAHLFPLPVDIGTHQLGEVSYEVKQQVGKPEVYQDDLIEEKVVRSVWQEKQKIDARLNISEILQIKNVDEVPLEIKIKSIYKASFGVEAHRLFESLKYQDVEQLIKNIKDENLIKAIRYLTTVNEVPFMQMIKNGFVEWGFVIQRSENKIQGQIDLWYSDDQTDYIVDYKTGKKEYVQKAMRQLEFYACCLNKMKKLKNRKLKLIVIYPLQEEIVIKEIENDHRQLSLDHFFKSGLVDFAGSN